MLADEVVEDLTDGGPLGRDGGLAAGGGSQDGGQTDVDGHGISNGRADGRADAKSTPLVTIVERLAPL